MGRSELEGRSPVWTADVSCFMQPRKRKPYRVVVVVAVAVVAKPCGYQRQEKTRTFVSRHCSHTLLLSEWQYRMSCHVQRSSVFQMKRRYHVISPRSTENLDLISVPAVTDKPHDTKVTSP